MPKTAAGKGRGRVRGKQSSGILAALSLPADPVSLHSPPIAAILFGYPKNSK